MMPTVWLLDVDGVLNATRPSGGAAPVRRTVRGHGEDWPLRYSSVVVARIRALIEGGAVDVRWCSTWCGDTAGLERSFGFPALPSAFALPLDWDLGVAAGLKLRAACEVLAAGCRLIWTDDTEVPRPDFPLYEALTTNNRALLIRPTGRRGLTSDHMDLIEAFMRDDAGGGAGFECGVTINHQDQVTRDGPDGVTTTCRRCGAETFAELPTIDYWPP